MILVMVKKEATFLFSEFSVVILFCLAFSLVLLFFCRRPILPLLAERSHPAQWRPGDDSFVTASSRKSLVVSGDEFCWSCCLRWIFHTCHTLSLCSTLVEKFLLYHATKWQVHKQFKVARHRVWHFKESVGKAFNHYEIDGNCMNAFVGVDMAVCCTTAARLEQFFITMVQVMRGTLSNQRWLGC